MRCAEFRDQHCSFVDDTLAGVELVRMQRHVTECRECAGLDARVRRSLMLVRSLPPVEPSGDFSKRLEAKLRACQESCGKPSTGPMGANFNAVAGIGVVASLMMLSYVATALYDVGAPPRDVVLPPVVAIAAPPKEGAPTLPNAVPAEASPAEPAHPRSRGETTSVERAGGQGEGEQPEIVRALQPAPAIIASVAAGIPLWPAALFAEQAPLHFASYRGDSGREVH